MTYAVRFSALLRMLMGMVLWNEMFILWSSHFFNAQGFMKRTLFLAHFNHWQWLQNILVWCSAQAVWLMPLAAALMLLCSIMLLLGYVRRITCALTGMIFTVMFLAHAGVPGNWVFEYVMPASFCFALAWYYRNVVRLSVGTLKQYDFAGASKTLMLLLLLLFCGLVYWANIRASSMQYAGHIFTAWMVAIFFVVIALKVVLAKREPNNSHSLAMQMAIADCEYRLMGVVSILVGSMLATQVHMNYLFGWFTTQGYAGLIGIYQHYSAAPQALINFTGLIKQHLNVAIALQAGIEAFLPICLIALVLRPFASTLTFLLLLTLAVIEFGVPATFPVSTPIDHTWVWELLLSALVIGMVCYYEWLQVLCVKTRCRTWFGRPLFSGWSLFKRALLLALWVCVLFAIIVIAHNLAKVLLIFSLSSAVTLFLCLCLLHYVDHMREQITLKSE